MNPNLAFEQMRARRWGYCGLFAWAALGFLLEAAHGWKLAAYLDDELVRDQLRLGHAHGVLLALLLVTYSSAGVRLLELRSDCGRSVRLLLTAAGICMPVGFSLSIFGHAEADPGPAIWLVPIGAACLLAALWQLAIASFRH